MDSNTTTDTPSLFVLFVQNYDEPENEVDFLGVYPTLRAALQARLTHILATQDVDDPFLEEEYMEDFKAAFHGSPNDAWLDDGHQHYVVEEVKSFV